MADGGRANEHPRPRHSQGRYALEATNIILAAKANTAPMNINFQTHFRGGDFGASVRVDGFVGHTKSPVLMQKLAPDFYYDERKTEPPLEESSKCLHDLRFASTCRQKDATLGADRELPKRVPELLVV